MMRTRPARRTTLQCSHRTLTDGLTFISYPFEPSHRSSRGRPALGRPSSRLLEPFHRSSRGRPGASGTRPPLISSPRTISPLVSGSPGCLRHSAAPHLARLLEPVGDPAAGQVVGRELHLDLVPSQYPDEIHECLAV